MSMSPAISFDILEQLVNQLELEQEQEELAALGYADSPKPIWQHSLVISNRHIGEIKKHWLGARDHEIIKGTFKGADNNSFLTCPEATA
ncbi:hypothetical protein Tco_0648722 [Tanacetum coccineum]